MAETDVLRMVAEVNDRASGPLMQIRKNLKDLAGTDLSVHGRDLARVRREVDTLAASTNGFRRSGVETQAFGQKFKELSAHATQAGSSIAQTFAPVLATMGINGLLAAGSIAGMTAAVTAFSNASRSAARVARESGFGFEFAAKMQAVAQDVHLNADEMSEVLEKLGSQMNYATTLQGGELGAKMRLSPEFAATFGQMQSILKGADIDHQAEAKAKAMEVLVTRINDLMEKQHQPESRVRDMLSQMGLDPRLVDIAHHGWSNLMADADRLRAKMGQLDEKKAHDFAKSLRELSASITGLQNSISAELITDLTGLTNAVSGFIDANQGEITGGIVGAIREIRASASFVMDVVNTLKSLTPNVKLPDFISNAIPSQEKAAHAPQTVDEGLSNMKQTWGERYDWMRQWMHDRDTVGNPQANPAPAIELPEIKVTPPPAVQLDERMNHLRQLNEGLRRDPTEPPVTRGIEHRSEADNTRGIDVAALDANRELNKNTSQIAELNRLLADWLHPVNGSAPTSGPIKVASLSGGMGYSPAGGTEGTPPAGSAPAAPSITPMGKLPGFGTGSDGLSVTRPSALGSTSDEPSNVSTRPGGTIASPASRTKANEAASAFGGAQGTPAAAVDDAMANLEGKEEHRDGALIQRYLTSGDAGMNPADSAWCAATVNSALKRQGIQGSGSQLATSFLRWGKPVEGAIEKGDVLVQAHGHKFGERNGHVGFATGEERINPRTGQPEVEMFSGNKGDMGRRSWEPRSSVTPRRATDEMLAKAKAAAPTTRVEAPNSSRAGDTPAHFANVRSNNPGAMYMGPSAETFGALGKDIIDHGKHEIANFPTPVHGLAANMDNLSQHYEGMRIGDAIKKWSDNGRGEVPGFDRNQVITKEMLANKDFMVPFFKSLTKGEAPGNYPMSEAQRKQAFEWYQQGHPGEHALARDESPELSAGVLNVKKMTGDLPQNAAPSGSMLMDSARAPTPGTLEPGSLLAKEAEATKHEVSVSNTGSIDVNVRAPRGTSVKAGGDGPLFDNVRLNRTHATEPSPATQASNGEE